jgi:serine protease
MRFVKFKRPLRPQAVLGALLAATLAAPLAVQAGGPSATAVTTSAAVRSPGTDRLIIKFRDSGSASASGASAAPAAQRALPLRSAQDVGLRHGVNMQLLRQGAAGTHVMKFERRLPNATVEQMAREVMAADPTVEYAEPDHVQHALFTPNDTNYGSQWHYHEATGGLNLPAAWDKSTGSGVVVAVVDTGYRPHADLAANLLPGYDMIADTFVSNDGNARDSSALDPGDAMTAGECGTDSAGRPVPPVNYPSSWHGTHVAGTIAAVTNNGSGVAGVAYNAKIVPVRVLGKCGGYTSDIADGIVWASGGTVSGVPANANPARVINLSLGGEHACSTTERNAITSARSRGAVIVVAAGNDGANAGNYSPASCAGVITVAATTRSGGRAPYSNFGSVVSVAAPGGDMSVSSANGILSTLNNGSTSPGADAYAWYEGTSMATPHVVGVVALMLSKNSALTPDEVATRLKASTRAFPASCSGCGTGIVDASAAVDAAGGTTPPPTGNEVEPNNSTGTAQVVAKGTTLSGSMASSSDNDYFRVAVPAGGTLSARLTPNASSDYDLYVYNASGTQVGSSVKGTGQVDTVTVTNGGAAANYFVRVRFYSGSTGSAGTYTLALD